MSEDLNVLALVKGEERYIFLFDDNNRAETLRTLGRYASDPDLSFSWYDAAVLSQKIRKTLDEKSTQPVSARFDADSVTESIEMDGDLFPFDGEEFSF